MKPRPAFAECDYTSIKGKAQVSAIKALAAGEASAAQQIEAVNAILDICKLHDLPWFPDDFGGERDSSFAAGRAFVGHQIRRVITQPFDRLTGGPVAEVKPRLRTRKTNL